MVEPADTGASDRGGPEAVHGDRRAGRRRPAEWWRWALGLGLLMLLVGVVGPRRLAETFARIEAGPALAVVALSLVWLGLSGLNVWLLLRRLRPLPLRVFLPIYGTSWAAAQLLPGQLGDATQVLLLRRHEVPVAQSGAAYLVDKAVSFGWMSVVALYGVARFAPGLSSRGLALVPVLGLAAAACGVWLVLELPAGAGGLVERLQNLLRRTGHELAEMRRHGGALALNLGLTLVKWGVTALMYVGAFRAFGQAISFEAAATLPIMSSLVGYLPITVGGAGTIEITGVYLFGRIGIDAAVVLAVYLFFRAELLAIALLAAVGGRR